jgi:ABC-type nitrate/sulfonate/bicarbonate transport system substrate-binding protein
MRRLFEVLILWFPLVLAPAWPAQERITVLYPSPAGSWMIPVIAKEAKYFEKEGLSLEYVREISALAAPVNFPAEGSL